MKSWTLKYSVSIGIQTSFNWNMGCKCNLFDFHSISNFRRGITNDSYVQFLNWDNCKNTQSHVFHSIFLVISEQESSAKFTSELKDQRGVDGMKLKLEAFFAGNPEPEVKLNPKGQ